jgi:hypothetical protein
LLYSKTFENLVGFFLSERKASPFEEFGFFHHVRDVAAGTGILRFLRRANVDFLTNSYFENPFTLMSLMVFSAMSFVSS